MRKCKLRKISEKKNSKKKGKNVHLLRIQNGSVKPYKIIEGHKSLVMNKELARCESAQD